jgi:hypothetical protein
METKAKIFLTLFLTYAFFTNTYLTTNDASRFSLTAAIVEEQTFEIDNFLEKVISDWWWAKDFATYGGNKYSDKAPLGSFLGVPIYMIVRLFTSDFGTLAYFVSLFTTGLLTAATALLIFDLGRYFATEKKIDVSLALTYGIGTLAFFYGTVFFSHAITSFFGFGSFYLLFRSKWIVKDTKSIALSGVFAALAVSSDYYAGIIAVALFGYAVTIKGRKAYKFLIAYFLTISLLLLYHWAVFKDPFSIPYLYANLYEDYHSRGLYGIRVPDLIFFQKLFSQLFAKWGFFFTTPLMLISFLSFPFFIRKYKEEAVFILAITFGFFSLVGSIGLFDAYSSRLLVPLVPFLLLPLYSLNLKRKEINLGFYFLILLSIVINFAGVDTFLPKVPDPSLILETYGNHNILGEFLLRNSINLHYLTITPLLIITAFIWNLEIRNFLQNIRRED